MPPFSTGYINWLAVALLIPLTLHMAPLGARLAHAMSKRQLEAGFGVFLVLISIQFFLTILI